MRARDVIADIIICTITSVLSDKKVTVSITESGADAILAAIDAAGFKIIHRDELMKFLKAMEAAKETT